MCGIIGHIAFGDTRRPGKEEFLQLNDLMRHRGPDGYGIFAEDEVVLAMRRLAIIDIAGGDQPITTADGRYVIVFNGEIYNYEELRQELLGRGCPIQSRSDTETLLYAYAEFGADCLHKLNGMFAFAIWDRRENSLFVARDRLGVKPLYYAANAERVLFASELTPIARSGLIDLEPEWESVADLLAYWYVCEPKTMFRGVRQLPPGHHMTIANGTTTLQRWWTPPHGPERAIGFDAACEELDALLDDAVRLRLRSDVPVGTFLSGGIDSGLISAHAAPHMASGLKCFSIGFKEKSYSELELAEQTAARIGVTLNATIMDRIDADEIDRILAALDEPLGNASFIPTYLLFKAAHRNVSVILTGDGGDELFGGYPTYQAPYYQRIHNAIPGPVMTAAKSLIDHLPVSHSRISLDYRLKQFARSAHLSPDRAHVAWRAVMNIEEQLPMFRSEVLESLAGYDPFSNFEPYFRESAELDWRNRFMYADIHTYLLNDHLRKIDRMSMAHSVEARQPFLDYRVVEFAMNLPAEHKVSFRQTKRILKKLAADRLPHAVVHGAKKGLTPPIASWIANDLRDYVYDQLSGGMMDRLFKPGAVRKLLDAHFAKRVDYSRCLWSLLSLQVWDRRLQSSE
jgi:asparagine synthase (glutamine-hydrolysing)